MTSGHLRKLSNGRFVLPGKRTGIQTEALPENVIHCGDLFDVLPTLEAASIDACVTDPPYGIAFMNQAWDNFSPTATAARIVPNRAIASDNPNLKGRTRGPASSPSAVEYNRSLEGQRGFQGWTERWAREVFRVLKPGAHLLVCGAPRSFHRMTCGLEDAGFEIRDCLSWLYGQGFPKSLNVGEGRGTALKPGWEPIVLARKPFSGTVAANVLTHGTGALNIDACRIETTDLLVENMDRKNKQLGAGGAWSSDEVSSTLHKRTGVWENTQGRWPSNVCLDDQAAALLDQQTGELTSGDLLPGHKRGDSQTAWSGGGGIVRGTYGGDTGGASRFFYVAKPSREERDYGCAGLTLRAAGVGDDRPSGDFTERLRPGERQKVMARNFHPTVKPIELMRWLVKLITPIGGTVLDPFTGSGTTGMACRYEQRQFIGIEREAEYVTIARKRIEAVAPLFGDVSA